MSGPRGGARRALPLVAFLLLAVIPASALAAGPPVVEATWVTDVTATSAKLHGEANPEGLLSTYRFEYLSEAAYQTNLEAGREGFAGASRAPHGEAGLGEEAGPASALQPISGLTPGTAYRFRLTATNTAGPTSGPLRTFRTQSPVSQAPESCANAQLRIEDASTALPDCRAWEQVSPPEKNGGAVQGFGQNLGGDVLQAAADGEAATFSSRASFGPEAEGAPSASQYLARRGAGGWTTQNITAPTLSGAYGAAPDGVPYQLFSPDLRQGLLLDGSRCEEGAVCPTSYSARGEDGSLTPLLEAPGLRFAGGTSNLVHQVFATCAALTGNAVEVGGGGGGCDPAEPNLYELSPGGSPQLVNVLPGQSQGTPGAALAAQAGAVSADGARVYWVDAAGDLYLYEAGVGKTIDASGAAVFQVASADGSLAYFLEAGHLYRYSTPGESSVDLTPAGGVEGVLGASEDGSAVYYATATGIFLWWQGTATEVAGAPEAADPGDYPPASGTARVSADGTHLAFLSKAVLSGYDNTDQRTGHPDTELYLYSTAGGLICASCNPTGERPLGPATIPGAPANGTGPGATQIYKPRVLSADGGRLFFDSADRLVPRDSSAAVDVYEWEASGEGTCSEPGGCVFVISSGHSAAPSEFIDASADGADVFFLTADSLFPSDPGSVDLYDAREGGGFPVPPPPIPCEGDACQALPSPPEDPSPGTLVPSPPNPKPHFPKTHHKKPKKKKRHHHVKRHHHKRRHPRSSRRTPRRRLPGVVARLRLARRPLDQLLADRSAALRLAVGPLSPSSSLRLTEPLGHGQDGAIDEAGHPSALGRGVERRADLGHPLRGELALSFGQLPKRHHQQVVEVDHAGLAHPVALHLRGDAAHRPRHHRDQNLAERADHAVAGKDEIGAPPALWPLAPPHLTASGPHYGVRLYQGRCPAARSSSSRCPSTARREDLWTSFRSAQPSGSNRGVRSYDSTTCLSISRSRSSRAYSAFSEGAESWSTSRSNFSRVVTTFIVPAASEPTPALAATSRRQQGLVPVSERRGASSLEVPPTHARAPRHDDHIRRYCPTAPRPVREGRTGSPSRNWPPPRPALRRSVGSVRERP
jgi:hypothetical protein